MSHVKISELEVNEAYRNALPKLSAPEFKRLYESISEDGQQVPIIVDYENKIVDGHNRVDIFEELGIQYIEADFKDFGNEEETVKKIKDLQFARRNMSKEKIEDYILQRATQIKEELGERRGGHSPRDSELASSEDFGQKTSEVIAEKVSEELRIPVSTSKVERTLSKDKPKVFKKKEVVDAVAIMLRYNSSSWRFYGMPFVSKKEARDFINRQLEDKDPTFTHEWALAKVTIDFFSEVDQKAWDGWLKS